MRGVRPLGDFETEYSMAQMNRMLGGVETLLMTTSETCAGISSSIVRQIAAFGGDIDSLVPEGLAQDIRAALSGRGGEEEEPYWNAMTRWSTSAIPSRFPQRFRGRRPRSRSGPCGASRRSPARRVSARPCA